MENHCKALRVAMEPARSPECPQKLPASHSAAAMNKILQSLGHYYERETESPVSRASKTQQQFSKVNVSCYQATALFSLSPLS